MLCERQYMANDSILWGDADGVVAAVEGCRPTLGGSFHTRTAMSSYPRRICPDSRSPLSSPPESSWKICLNPILQR